MFYAFDQLATRCCDDAIVTLALRGLLHICNIIMRAPSASSLALQVSDNLLPSLLETWVKVCAQRYPSPRMWARLTASFRSWRRWTKACTWWGLVLRRLTQRVVDVLYGGADVRAPTPATLHTRGSGGRVCGAAPRIQEE